MVIIFLVLTKYWNRFGDQTLTTRFGHFYAGIKIAKTDSYAPLFRLFVFLIKRLVIVQIALFASEDPYLQVLVYINL